MTTYDHQNRWHPGDEFDDVAKAAHYNRHPSGIECVDIMRPCHTSMGTAIKYVWRYEHKNGVKDLKKARYYLSDVLAEGMSHYPPYASRVLLERAIEADDNGDRRVLLSQIVTGQLSDAIDWLTAMIERG